jgi:hypothetical protein
LAILESLTPPLHLNLIIANLSKTAKVKTPWVSLAFKRLERSEAVERLEQAPVFDLNLEPAKALNRR